MLVTLMRALQRNRFQFGIIRLLGLTFTVASWLSLYSYGERALPLALPLVLFTALMLGARPTALKAIGFLVALGGMITGFYVAVRSYPIIVIADNLAGAADALRKSRDAAVFGAYFLGLAVLASGALRWRWVYWGCALSLGAMMITVRFASDGTLWSARWVAIVVLACLVTLRFVRDPSPNLVNEPKPGQNCSVENAEL